MFKTKTTMKKQYINPAMEIIKIASRTQMLAGSTVPTGTTPTNPATSDSRFFAFEDDDEEDW